MEQSSYVTFNLRGLVLAVPASSVKEMVWLPELTRIEESADYIVGVVNLHGQLLPVMDLNLRFGSPLQRYQTSDRLIVLDVTSSGFRCPRFAIIVNDLLDVLTIPSENIESPPFVGRELSTHPHFVSGVAKVAEQIVMVLSLQGMLDPEFELPSLVTDYSDAGVEEDLTYFCPEATQSEREIFHARAIELHAVSIADDVVHEISVAVVTMQNEYLGVELGAVREFANRINLTPVPCCPDHIVGNMNLRGNVLTVLDLGALLGMGQGRTSSAGKVIVTEGGGFSVGILVDDILDIVNLRAMDLLPVPPTVKVLNEKFVKGLIPYDKKMMALLDLTAIMAWEGLVVDEEV